MVHTPQSRDTHCRQRSGCRRSMPSTLGSTLAPRRASAMPATVRAGTFLAPRQGGTCLAQCAGRRPSTGNEVSNHPEAPVGGTVAFRRGGFRSDPPSAWPRSRAAPSGAGERGAGYPGFGWQPHPGLPTIGPFRGRDRPGHIHRRRSRTGTLAGLLQRHSLSPWIEPCPISP